MTNSPVLFLIFNRTDLTEKVFSAIREAKPTQLFIAADGPRADKPGEKEKCELTRNLVLNGVDWNCEVHTLLRDENWGCGKSPADAITWFFNHVEQGIILEDDCLPALSFFRFCDELLDKYKDDERVAAISGTNLLGTHNTDYSYFFSVLGGNWGWASWRRAWKHFDYNIKSWKSQQSKKTIQRFVSDDEIFNYYKKNFDEHLKKPRDDAWDYQWLYCRWLNKSISIVPSHNQILNIGFGEDATHTFDSNNSVTKLTNEEIQFPLSFCERPVIDQNFDRMLFERYIKEHNEPISIYAKIKRKIKNIF